MVVSNKEVDFPRGGAPSSTTAAKVVKSTGKRKADDGDVLFGDGKKVAKKGHNDQKQKQEKIAEKPKNPLSSIWQKRMTPSDLTEGVMGIGIVREIDEDEIELETADSCRVNLPLAQIGKQFTKVFKAGGVSLSDMFHVGQAVPFKVISPLVDNGVKGKKYAIVSCDPSKLNSHIVPSRMVKGLVLHAIVESVEEKGAVLDIGLQSIKGFLPNEKQTSSGVKIGSPVLVRVEEQQTRIVKVSAFAEQDNLSLEACEELALNHLMPGTIIECEPSAVQVKTDGLFVEMGNGVKGFLPRRHLPPRLRIDISRISKAIRCVVMFCQQNSNMLVLSAHPDIVALSKFERRTSFEDYNVGDRVKCKVIDVAPKGFTVNFSPPLLSDGKIPLFTAVCSKSYLNKAEECETFYSIGSEHECRIIDFRYAERQMIVATSKKILKQKIVSYKDAENAPGELVTAKVVRLNASGAHLSVFDMIKGFLPVAHASDKPCSIEKLFPVGREFTCRLLYANPMFNSVVVTARPSFINSKHVRVVKYDDHYVGQITVGYIDKILPTEALIVRFFNGVKGLVPAVDAKRLGNLSNRKNQSVEVRVISVDKDANRMLLNLADETLKSSTTILKVEQTNIMFNGPESFEFMVEETSEINLDGRRSEKAIVSIQAAGKKVRASLAASLVSDSLDPPFECLKGVIVKGTKLNCLSLLGNIAGASRVLFKPFVRNWLEDPVNSIPTCFDDIKAKQLLCAVVFQRMESRGTYVEFVGGSGVIAKILNEKEKPQSLQIGQTLLVRVQSVDSKKHLINVSCNPSICYPDTSPERVPLSLVKSFVDEQMWLSGNTAAGSLPSPGSAVKVSVTHIVDGILFVKFNDKLTGCIRPCNYQDGVKVGDSLDCRIIEYTFPRNDAELVQTMPLTKKSKNKDGANDRVILAKRDYIVVLSEQKLVYVPSRLHPNTVPLSKNERATVGNFVKLDSVEDLGNSLAVGLLVGDMEVLSASSSGNQFQSGNVKTDVVAVNKKSNSGSQMIVQTFPDKSGKPVVDSKEGESNATKSIKNYGVYAAEVVGKMDLNGSNEVSVKLKLPGGHIGNLHISEFPLSYYKTGDNISSIMETFINRNILKKVHVRIMGFSKVGTDALNKVRIVDVTMNDDKMVQSKIRQRFLGYRLRFETNVQLRCFVTSLTATTVNVEVNPLVGGFIQKDSETLDDVKLGDIVLANVISCTKQNQRRFLQLSLQPSTKKCMKKLEEESKFGDLMTGRVKRVDEERLFLHMQLSTGKMACISPTAFSDDYSRAKHMISEFNMDETYPVHYIRHDDSAKRHYVMTEQRFSSVQLEKAAKNPTSLIRSLDDVHACIGKNIYGFVSNVTERGLFIELGPGINGYLKKTNNCVFGNSFIGSLLSVTVKNVMKSGKVSLGYVDTLTGLKKITGFGRKRTSSEMESDETIQKTKSLENDIGGAARLIDDPGFDFSNSGFRPEDLVAIGKIGELSSSGAKAEISLSEPVLKKKAKAVTATIFTKEEKDLLSEQKLSAKEAQLAADSVPETDEDFNRLLRKDPNSADVWIRYISFFLEKANLAKARATANRALEAINYREDAELFNMWTAYMNMEVAYGDSASTRAVFERACGNVDSLRIHKQLASILVANGKNEEADEIFNSMIRRFRASSDDVWYLYAEHLMSTERVSPARELLQRALTSVPKSRHSLLISRFAQLEYKKGDAERGRTLFESLVQTYPKKTDIWMVYADYSLKYSGIESARQVFERACSISMSLHKLRPIFKKWMEAEEKHGDDQSQQLVQSKAQRVLEDINV